MNNRVCWKTLATACMIVAVFLAINGKSWSQTSKGIAVVRFTLTGLSTTTGQLTATANPTRTSRCVNPAVVKVTGGKPPYVVTCQSSFFEVVQRDASTFTVTSLRNTAGKIGINVTDSAKKSTQVTILGDLCFK